ncbi:MULTISPECIES: tetratricopeptide repeat protein [unclassified Modicisalibacter]|uniref:tetratricopeptide repeat protein n=1 Tax=unclassified Modicisalibacter TaxID=2679913 RepID=UPI001CCE0DCD|nr:MULTISPECIES: tetratricopeptide repeat protein [unclassified Modicisalibacter]MBZ9560526.1 sel1 repeat family protein [Modicisalibacter sp. R2A 31.J]MBZ9574702.1 sel1 repeat family protein [Modicisalibacter sp. MOD 31.J]
MKHLFFIIALFLSNSAQAKVLFHDPTGKALNAAIDNLSEKDVKDLSTPDASRKKFFLGLFYINGAPEFHIEKDCKKSVAFLQDAWDEDIADAGYTLSTMYYNGVCTEKNIAKSRELATQAAQGGYILAQRMLGMAYVGEKWKKLYPYNVDKGIYWLSKAGNAGDGEAAGQLSHMYGKGDGVPKDEDKYFCWLKKAVFTKYEKGNMLGMPGLAKAYENGIGTKKDLVKAYKYYDLIGTAGVKGKQRIAKQMTQEQINKALSQSRDWQKENNVQTGSGVIWRVK